MLPLVTNSQCLKTPKCPTKWPETLPTSPTLLLGPKPLTFEHKACEWKYLHEFWLGDTNVMMLKLSPRLSGRGHE